MHSFSFIGIFCEDIREEVGGTHSIVGVLPDNVTVGGLPGMMPKLGIYIRIHLEKDANPKVLRARIKIPGGQVFEIADFAELIGTIKEQAEASNTPYAGLIAKGTFSPLPINELGRIEAIVEVDGAEHICAVLNLVQAQAPDAPSTVASPPA